MVDSQWLTAFIAFAEELNFTRAAARLHISQPALHVQIQKLSEALGIELYRREGRSLALSREGVELLGFAREIRERTTTFLSGLHGTRVETVVLAAGAGTLLYVLGDAVRTFARRRDVRLRVLTRERDGVLAALRTGDAHVGVTPLEVVPEGFAATPLRKVGMMVVMPQDHPLRRKRRLRLSDLGGQRLIVPPAERPHRQALARALASAGVEWELAVEASGWELMLQYASLGVGLAVVNDICKVPRGAIARPLPELPALQYYLVRHSRRPPAEAALELIRLVVGAFAAPRRPATAR